MRRYCRIISKPECLFDLRKFLISANVSTNQVRHCPIDLPPAKLVHPQDHVYHKHDYTLVIGFYHGSVDPWRSFAA